MKQILFITIILSIAYPAFSQDTIRYPYSCYMEWPMDSNMNYQYNFVKNQKSACIIYRFRRNETYAREFYVNGPTKIYGIAATLWGQDTARRDLNVLLFSLNNTDVMPPKVLRWSDTLPYRYFVYEAIDCLPTSETYGKQFMEMVKAYEFYFDTPVVVTDTFFVGYHTLGVDGRQHPYCSWDIDSTGYAYMTVTQNPCDTNYIRPLWRFIDEHYKIIPSPFDQHRQWGGLFPILHPQCNPDTISCPVVEQLRADTVDSLHVRFSWLPTDSRQQHYQISIGPQGTPPDENRIFDIDSNPYTHRDNWDTSIVYAAYVRAQCLVPCYAHDSLYWSDWSQPALFTFRRPDPIGIDSPDSRALFTIQPNPARESVTITLVTPTQAPNAVTLLDAAGHTLLQTSFSGTTTTIDTRSLSAGTYFLTLSTPETTATRKLIIE